MKNEVYEQCKNCRHFLRHYVIDGCRLLPLHEGHCEYSVRRGFKMRQDCALRESREEIAADKVAELLAHLRETVRNIGVIECLLKDYCDLLAQKTT